MKCCKCGKEMKYINTGSLLTNIRDCNCGSIIIEIPKNNYTTIEDIQCEHCGEYPFEKNPDRVEEFIKISFVKEEEN